MIEEGEQQVVDEKDHKTVTQPNYHIVVIRRDAQNNWHLHQESLFQPRRS